MSVAGRSLSRVVLVLVAVLLVMAAAGTVGGQTTSKGSDVFDDVPAGHWADVPIGWAVQNDITRGVGSGRFGLEGIVNRAQIVTFLYRTVNHFRGAPEDPPQKGSALFGDVPAGHWADVSIGWAVSKGLIEGVDDGVFGLDATVPRSEVVALLHRTVNLIQGRPLTARPESTLVFASDRDGDDFEIVVMNADGANLRQLTKNATDEEGPSWSPDGTKIAYTRGSEAGDIFVIDADGTNKRQLTTGRRNFDPTWSPDGTKIAYTNDQDREWNYQIFVIDADGTNKRQLTTGGENFEPTWSPDGTKIAYTRGFEAGEIHVMDADGGNKHQLTNNTTHDGWPTWSPDGTKIAYTRGFEAGEILVMDADGGNKHQLTNNTTDEGEPRWSPDGTLIAFTGGPDRNTEIFVMDADGRNKRQLTNNSNSWSPRWSPDGTLIAFSRGVEPNEIFVMDADGRNQRRLTNNTGDYIYNWWLSWSPVTPGGSASFDDVSPQHQADPSIGWAVTNGITSGIGNRMFDPDGTVDRAQIVTFLYRTAKLLRDASGT